jgi:hypothetical protein
MRGFLAPSIVIPGLTCQQGFILNEINPGVFFAASVRVKLCLLNLIIRQLYKRCFAPALTPNP